MKSLLKTVIMVAILSTSYANAQKAQLAPEQIEALNAEGKQSLESIQSLPQDQITKFVDINRQRRLALRGIVSSEDISWLPRLTQIID